LGDALINGTGIDVAKIVEDSIDGSTIFEFTINDDTHLITSSYARLSRSWVYNSSKLFFKYGVNEQIKAYLSPECQVVSDEVYDLAPFAAAYKFSHFHRFTAKEWADTMRRQNLTILFVQGNIDASGFKLLRVLSREFCGKSLFGWAPIGFSFKILAALIHGDQSRPFLARTDPNGCRYLYRNEIDEGNIREFLEKVDNGIGKCVRGSPRITAEPTLTPEVIPEVNFIPWVIGVIFVGIAIVIVLTRERWQSGAHRPGAIRAFKRQ
jgi:hypothetical protein